MANPLEISMLDNKAAVEASIAELSKTKNDISMTYKSEKENNTTGPMDTSNLSTTHYKHHKNTRHQH